MNFLAIKFKLAVCALLIAASVSAVLYVRALRAQLGVESGLLRAASQRIEDRDRTIRDLQRDALEKARQQAQLDRATAAAEKTISTQRQAMREAIHDSPTVHAWADTALPDDVVRLSANPAYTGSADFSAAVPDDHAVRSTGDVTTH
ncbi:protein lysB [Caballeronia sp. LZ001]|uniref:protein lysB n=1 Tax=Caballeronia sp. LZ001 TaxID=3038553 RepID=UPI00285EB911|nr:protein lysB [Caballeronia sp. LZ001]MDR5800060.1 protein lysB [Caballeronia sp. LZ001]MDR5801916.1 protein lysB [Caballeronia sp. LZ001]MDR5805281.1 protein lysB [Caballeronia sp. LZ001]